MIYFTSDLHLFHGNILNYCAETRPYQSAEEMNASIINKINSTCSASDELYILGDIGVGNSTKLRKLIPEIKARKFLIRGNHDHFSKAQEEELFEKVWDYRVVHSAKNRIVCCHYPIERWDRAQYGVIHLHGHCHGDLERILNNRFDIGWDVHQRPVSFDEVMSWKQDKNFVTHHGQTFEES